MWDTVDFRIACRACSETSEAGLVANFSLSSPLLPTFLSCLGSLIQIRKNELAMSVDFRNACSFFAVTNQIEGESRGLRKSLLLYPPSPKHVFLVALARPRRPNISA